MSYDWRETNRIMAKFDAEGTINLTDAEILTVARVLYGRWMGYEAAERNYDYEGAKVASDKYFAIVKKLEERNMHPNGELIKKA